MKIEYELVPGGLTTAQISAMTALVRGAHTDAAASVPEGTMASLVALGFAYKNFESFWPMTVTIKHVSDWEKVGARRGKVTPKVIGRVAKPIKNMTLDMRVLSAVGATNPSKAGSKAHGFYELIRSAGTVSEYYTRGGNKAYLEWFIARGAAKIGD